ncbi:MAG: hypothetical protein ACREV0_08205 [Burkholderiales bacterium]
MSKPWHTKAAKPIDWKRLDADADSRVCRTEWTECHSAFKSDGSKDSGSDERSGAAGHPAVTRKEMAGAVL